MENPWTAAVFGVRGSVPRPEKEFLTYGGNTSCILADCGGSLVVFDAGTGLSRLEKYPRDRRPIHIFLSHLHIDHMIGLAGCPVFFDPGASVHIYGEAKNGVPLKDLLQTLMSAPYWPVGLDDFRADITIHEIGPDLRVPLDGGLSVRTLRGRHPNGVLYYRLEGGGRSLVYMLDCEPDDAYLPVLAEFARGANLLVWDAHFTEPDLRKGWGHSTWNRGLSLRRDAGAEKILMAHYAQDYTDTFLLEQERLCKKADPSSCFAKEGMEILI